MPRSLLAPRKRTRRTPHNIGESDASWNQIRGGGRIWFVNTRSGKSSHVKHAPAAAAISRIGSADRRISESSAQLYLQWIGTDVTVIRDYLGHARVATTGRYITTNLQMMRDAMQSFWKKAVIEPAATKAWKPKSDLLLFSQVQFYVVSRTAIYSAWPRPSSRVST